MKGRELPFPFPLDDQTIRRNRALILANLCAIDQGFCSVPVSGIQSSTLYTMLCHYDTLFFNGFLAAAYPDMKLSLSGRLISTAGKFIYSLGRYNAKKHAEIRMSSDFLLRLHKGPFELNGLSVSTPQEAFLVVFEHELCHAVEAALYGQTAHSSRFLSLANGVFGHTATRHRLPTRKQEAALEGIYIGRRMRFMHDGKSLVGIITYVGKTVTVMVPSIRGKYRDRLGRRYDKYHLQIAELQTIQSKRTPS